MIEFEKFPKIARLNRDMVITEKIDGTNAAVGVFEGIDESLPIAMIDGTVYSVYAQSRNRIITPTDDNYGFARWVYDNAYGLAKVLGPGIHFGEWWGSGINRGYDLPKGMKRFSLFNTKRWGWIRDTSRCGPFALMPPELDVVPEIYRGPFSTGEVRVQLACLEAFGSVASPGFMNPEGVVVYHTAGSVMFKATIDNDEAPKSLVKDKPVNMSLSCENLFEDHVRGLREDLFTVFGIDTLERVA